MYLVLLYAKFIHANGSLQQKQRRQQISCFQKNRRLQHNSPVNPLAKALQSGSRRCQLDKRNKHNRIKFER